MERLDFTLPDFTRFAWVSDAARDVWEPRLDAWERRGPRSSGARCGPVALVRVVIASPEEFLTRAPDGPRRASPLFPSR